MSPWINYAINKDYISEYLCINKDQPELQCDGKCYLSQQLKILQEKEQSDTKVPSAIEPYLFWGLNSREQSFLFSHTQSSFMIGRNESLFPYDLFTRIDRPPIES